MSPVVIGLGVSAAAAILAVVWIGARPATTTIDRPSCPCKKMVK